MLPNIIENVITACEKKLQELFPAGIPDDARNRYDQELKIFLSLPTENQESFELYRLLSKEARRCNFPTGLGGTTAGMMLSYLLGDGGINPLDSYYYCPKCGYYEKSFRRIPAIDLPQRTCGCGAPLHKDGFYLPIEFCWGMNPKKYFQKVYFDLFVPKDFFPFAKRLLERLYPEKPLAVQGQLAYDEETKKTHLVQTGFALLPSGSTLEDFEDITDYLEDGTPCIVGNSFDLKDYDITCVHLHEKNYLTETVFMQHETGIHYEDISIDDLSTVNMKKLPFRRQEFTRLVQIKKPKSFYDLASLFSLSLSTRKQKNASERTDAFHRSTESVEFMNTDAFKKYPVYSREDFFFHFLDLGFTRDEAFQNAELIRMGKIASGFKPLQNAEQIPVELTELASSFLYLFPRAHVYSIVLHTARLAYYAKFDSKAYVKAIYRITQ